VLRFKEDFRGYDVWDPCFIKCQEFGNLLVFHTQFDQEKVAYYNWTFLFKKETFQTNHPPKKKKLKKKNKQKKKKK